MDEEQLLERIAVNPRIFGGKPIIRGRRLAVEHVLGMMTAGDKSRRYSRATPGWSETTFELAWCTRTGSSNASASNR